MGQQQEVETLISEEALLFAQYIRNEKNEWIPRIPGVNSMGLTDEKVFKGC
jgi:hypothetical protein